MIRDAEPAQKAAVYDQLGLKVTYLPAQDEHRADVTASYRRPMPLTCRNVICHLWRRQALNPVPPRDPRRRATSSSQLLAWRYPRYRSRKVID